MSRTQFDGLTAPANATARAEDFAAVLTEAAFPLILRQQPQGSWLDLELNLWKVLGQTVQTALPGI